MADLIYGTATELRDRGNIPPLRVINMVAETATTEPTTILQSRPGLQSSSMSMGSGAIKALFQTEGVLASELFGVSGFSLYSNSTLVGNINGTGPVSFGGYADRIFLAAGSAIWTYDGTTLTDVAMPDLHNVIKLCVGSSRLITIANNSAKVYWSDPLSTNIDSLSFATAEYSPDNLRDLLFIGDTLILFGSETVEFWPSSGDADLPFQPLVGRVYPVGIRATGCAVKFGTSFAWVTEENQICLGSPDQVISLPWLQEKIADSTTAKLWTFRMDGDEYLAVRLNFHTFVFGSRSQQWTEMASYGEANWLPQCYENGKFGSSANGTLIEFADDYDDFGDVMERRFTAWMPITDGVARINNLTVRANTGFTPYLTGLYSAPVIEMRASKDAGQTWSDFRPKSLGAQGDYREQPRWNSLGTFGYPGMMAEFRVTDPVPFRVSHVTANEPFVGV